MKSIISRLTGKKSASGGDPLWLETLSRYEDVLKMDKKNIEAHIQILSALLNLNRIEDFEKRILVARKLFPTNITLRKLQVRLLARVKGAALANEGWREILLDVPGDMEAIVGIATGMLAQQKFDEAVVWLDSFKVAENTDAGSLSVLARACMRSELHKDRAEALWLRINETEPSAEAYVQMISKRLNDSIHDEATTLLDEAVMVFPDNVTLRLLQGRLGNRTDDAEMAITGWMNCIKLAPKNAEALMGMANIRFREENWEAAEEYARNAVKESEGKVKGLTLLARIAQAKARAKNAR